MANGDGFTASKILPWAQLAALVVAAVVAVQSIRSTTELLSFQIGQLSSVIAKLDDTVKEIDGRLTAVERAGEYSRGLMEGRAAK